MPSPEYSEKDNCKFFSGKKKVSIHNLHLFSPTQFSHTLEHSLKSSKIHRIAPLSIFRPQKRSVVSNLHDSLDKTSFYVRPYQNQDFFNQEYPVRFGAKSRVCRFRKENYFLMQGWRLCKAVVIVKLNLFVYKFIHYFSSLLMFVLNYCLSIKKLEDYFSLHTFKKPTQP